MVNILVTTLGTTWQIVPELLGFTNPGLVDLYADHPEKEAIGRARNEFAIGPVDELWMVTTKGEKTDKAIGLLLDWRNLLPEKKTPLFRIWRAAEVEDLASGTECLRMSECIFRLVLNATEPVDGGRVIVSLAGGRKTMSSDIQNAAAVFGCHALLHVIQNDGYLRILRGYGPERFTRPLPGDLKNAITPLVVGGRCHRSPVVDLAPGGPLTRERFPVPLAEPGRPMEIDVRGPLLVEEISDRQRTAGFIYCNHANLLMKEEQISNFLALYSLPPRLIEELKERRMGVSPERAEEELDWLKKLPKTELHCHLGGIADAGEIIEIASANLEAVERHRAVLSPWLDGWKRKLDQGLQDPVPFRELRRAVPGVPEPLCVAAFVLMFEDRPDLLDEIVFGAYRDEARFCGIKFAPYEALGDLQGSGLLQSEQSLAAACRILSRKAMEHNVRYLEVRCSPANYTRGGLDPVRVARIIDRSLSSETGPEYSMLFIASRHGTMSKVFEHIELAEVLMAEDASGPPRFRGFDLAGDEKACSPGRMRDAFMPMMEKCMHFTIHAGETQDVGSIWEAVYHLNAERIGHGLNLKDNPDLLDRFKDRNIALEMCPSSNFQIVGFRDNHLRPTREHPLYPLKEYLDQGLRVTVNTDNPGISRTDFTGELHRAARLTPRGLSVWEVLLLVRNGFKAAFCPRPLRHKILRGAESEILGIIEGGLPS